MPNRIISPEISVCTSSDFITVKQFVSEFCLDDNDLKPGHFLVAKQHEHIIGFGRLRNYGTCNELCSLGVVETFRLQGVGSQVSKALIEKSKVPLYTVTIIPGFFEKLGFRIVDEFPPEIHAKLNYCLTSLAVPETYVVMKYQIKDPEYTFL
jgi:N-acetylglutamate synthase-like GNAT family acetyltransferase